MNLYLLIFFLLLIFIIFNSSSSENKKNLPPGPKGYPVLGSILAIGLRLWNGVCNYEIFGEFCKQYGPVCGFYAGSKYIVIVEGLELAKAALASEDFAGRYRKDHIMRSHYFDDRSLGLVFSEGDGWKMNRRFTIRHLNEFGFKDGKTIENLIFEEISKFTDYFESLRKVDGGKLNLKGLFNLPAINTLWAIVAGEKFGYDDKKLRMLINLSNETARKEDPFLDLSHVFPFMRFIPGLTSFNSTSNFFKSLQVFFKTFLEERRKLGIYKDDLTNFADALLQKIEKKESIYYDDNQFIMTCIDLFFTGVDTTATSLEWAMLLLIHNPDKYKKLQEEIDVAIGHNKLPSLDDKTNLPYMEATMMEVLRLGNVVSINTRCSLKDTYINGYFIPEDTTLVVNQYGIHMSSEIWEDPEEFRPERFLDKDNKIINVDKIIPFGHGKRFCLGESLARKFIFIFLVSLLQRYDFKKDFTMDENTPHNFISAFTRSPKNVGVVAKNR